MKTKLVTFLLLSAALVAGDVRAQTGQTTAPAPAGPVVAPAATPNQTIYAPRLPSVNELTNIAAAQGLAVERVEQTSSQIMVVYKATNGQTNTVVYLLLPGATNVSAPVATPTTPPPVVVYEQAPRTIYYDSYGPGYYPYYPGYWYPPVSIGLGFGFRSGGYHGGYRGGSHHWR